MPKSKTRSSLFASMRGAALLLVSALAVFLAGELILLARTRQGEMLLARHFNLVGRARVTQILSWGLKRGLRANGVDLGAVRVTYPEKGPAPLRWEARLPQDGSLIQANYAMTHEVEDFGGQIISGREERLPDGSSQLALLVGLPGRYVTHQVVVQRAAPRPKEETAVPVALVLYGVALGDTASTAALDAPLPFTTAVVAGSRDFSRLLARVRKRPREVVLSLPMEPLNYPRISPGPGALLVTMRPAEVRRLVRKYLDQAGPIVAVSNHLGSLATQDARIVRALYQELRRARMPFLHVEPVAGAVCQPLASDQGISYASATLVLSLDPKGDVKNAEKRWKEALELARQRGNAIVMVRATPGIGPFLMRICPSERHPGVSLVPLSTLVPRPPAF